MTGRTEVHLSHRFFQKLEMTPELSRCPIRVFVVHGRDGGTLGTLSLDSSRVFELEPVILQERP